MRKQINDSFVPFILVSLAAVLATGCVDPFGFFGPARFKVTEIKRTTSIPDFDDQVVRRILDYDSQDRLSEIQERTDDDVRSFELGYDGTVVREIDFRGPGSDRVTVDFDITGGKITGGERRGDDFDSTFEIEYFNNDKRFFRKILVRQDLSEQFGSDVFHESEATFSYEGQRLDKVTTDSLTILSGSETTGETRTIQEFKYNGDNRIGRIDTETDLGEDFDLIFQSYSVDYNEQGKIDDVEDQDADDDDVYNVSYDEDGRVNEIEHLVGNTTILFEYSYDEGNVNGGFHGLDVPVPADLRGTMQEVSGAEVVTFPLSFVGR